MWISQIVICEELRFLPTSAPAMVSQRMLFNCRDCSYNNYNYKGCMTSQLISNDEATFHSFYTFHSPLTCSSLIEMSKKTPSRNWTTSSQCPWTYSQPPPPPPPSVIEYHTFYLRLKKFSPRWRRKQKAMEHLRRWRFHPVHQQVSQLHEGGRFHETTNRSGRTNPIFPGVRCEQGSDRNQRLPLYEPEW